MITGEKPTFLTALQSFCVMDQAWENKGMYSAFCNPK